jgi:hypothetical protein
MAQGGNAKACQCGKAKAGCDKPAAKQTPAKKMS